MEVLITPTSLEEPNFFQDELHEGVDPYLKIVWGAALEASNLAFATNWDDLEVTRIVRNTAIESFKRERTPWKR